MRAATVVLAAAIALVLAGCGDDEDSSTEAKLPPKQKIEQTGNAWAPLFAAADRETCRYLTQPACERIACKDVSGPILNCAPPTSAFRKSFEDATVQEIVIKGNRAAARFSNGEAVKFDHVSGYELGGLWRIHRLGGNAGSKLFEAAGLRE